MVHGLGLSRIGDVHMKGLCHSCYTSNVECIIDEEITGKSLCLICYEKRSKDNIEKYHTLLRKIPPRKEINIDAMTLKLKGKSED